MTNPPSLLGHSGGMPELTLDNDFSINSPRTLMDLMYDGFYALFLLKNGNPPEDESRFVKKLQQFLNSVDDNAKKMRIPAEEVHAAKYAFCAAIDETILRSSFACRDSWASHPIQLVLFGDQLAGENFFTRLEELRSKAKPGIQALEVFHLCLLLGFQGRYLLESPEKLHYLTARLGEEIAHLKGKPAVFAPHWDRPDQIANRLRTETPLWVIGAVFMLIALTAYTGFDKLLYRHSQQSISAYNDIIQLAPHPATLILSLP